MLHTTLQSINLICVTCVAPEGIRSWGFPEWTEGPLTIANGFFTKAFLKTIGLESSR